MGWIKQAMGLENPIQARLGEIDKQLREREIEYQMAKQGWQLTPADAPEDEQIAAIEAYVTTGKASWYPAGYRDEPVDTSGEKLRASSRASSDEDPRSHKRFGWF